MAKQQINESIITNSLSIGRKIGLFIEYLQKGGEVTIDGRTYVWLDDFITRTVTHDDGTETHFGIDGLAIKGVSINISTQEEKPYYTGQTDMPINQFVNLVEKLTEEDWFQITASLTLQSLNKKRG